MIEEVLAVSKRRGRSPLQILINTLLDASEDADVRIAGANGALEPSLNRLADCLLSVRDDPLVRPDGAHSYDEALERIQANAYDVLANGHDESYARAWSSAARAVYATVSERRPLVHDERYGDRVFTEQELDAISRNAGATFAPIVDIAHRLFADAYAERPTTDRKAA